jgi:GPH family glycoside/pentoside/hexuronide:cation symporter
VNAAASHDVEGAARSAPPLRFREKLGYGVGDTASHFVWDMVGFWLLVFYTDTLGIEPATAGTIMLIARVWDMVTDPVMGVVSDRTKTRFGKFRPYILWMAVPYAVLAVLAFSTPDFTPTGKAVWAGSTYLLLMTVFTAINLPYSSLAGVMTANPVERTALNQFRFACAFAGQLIVSGIALTMVRTLGQGDDARGYQLTMIVLGIVSIGLFAITFFSTRERLEPPPDQRSDLRQDVQNLLQNRPWVVLFLVGVCSFTLFALQNAVTAFYFEYYIGDGEQAQTFNVIGTLALIAAIPLAKPLAKRLGNRNTFMVCSLLTGVCYISMFLPGPENLTLIYWINILGKVSYAPTVPLLWTMIANTSDYSEWKTGRRATGLFFSAATLSMKFGWGIGGALGGYLLSGYGYVPNQPQTAEAIYGIKLMMTVLPGLLYILAAFLLVFYNLTKETVEQMGIELAARRTAAGEPPPRTVDPIQVEID